MPRLSLCLIARDEARFLPACLASVQGVVDEIVVADTGSLDETAALARAAGARVIDHPWADDFAAARNAALEASTGDWILVLDADERLAPGAGRALRRAIGSGGFACGLLPLHNADRLDATAGDILSGAARIGAPVALPRLLRRDAELRWWGAIHETVGPWVAAGRAVAMVQAPIVHFGAVPSLRDARDKGTRNRALLERHLARQPDDAWARAYLAWELLDAGALDRASREAARAWHDAVEARSGPDPLGRARDLSQAATLRAFTQLQQGDPQGALATVQEALHLRADHPNLAILRGAALDSMGDVSVDTLDEAIAGLVAARARDGEVLPTTPIPGATSWGAATLEAGLRIRRGEPDTALALLDAALQERPGHEAAVLAGAEAFLARRAGAAALQAVESALASDTPDAWTLAARAAHAAGEPATAAALARKARDAERRGWSAVRRRGDLARLEAALRARRTLERLVGAQPPPAADPAAATEAAAAALADGDPGTAVEKAASAIAGDVARATPWAVLGAALRAAGLAAPAERALETALALDPDSGFARTALARCLVERGEVGLATRHLRHAGDIEGLHALGVHRPSGREPSDLSIVVTTEDAVALVGLFDALALQDDQAGSFSVHVVGPSGVAAACDDRRPFPIDLHADHAAAFASCAAGLVLLLGADRRPAPDLLGRHRAAHGDVAQVVIGSGGVASLDAASELDSVLDALEGEPAPGGWPDGPPGNASLPRSAIRAAGPQAFEGGDLTRLLPALAARGVASVFAAGCRAPRAATPGLDALRDAARVTGRALAATADRARSLADMEAALTARTRLEEGAQQARRLAEALERAAHRRGRPDGEALRTRTDAMRTLLTADREHARAVAAAGRVEPDPPLLDRLTSVVMLNLNGKGHLYGAVQSLRAHSPGPVELIVVDNGSTDESLGWLRAQSDIVLLEMGRNLGAPAGRNRGLEVARGDTILFCDNDVVFTPGWRELLIGHLVAWPDVGAVGPMSDVVIGSQLVENPPPDDADLAAWATAFTQQHRGRSMWSLRLILFCMMFRRDAIEDIGGIDPRYGRWGFEDDDLSLRLARAGWHQRVAGDCFIQHLGSRTARSANIDYQALLLENWGNFKRRWNLPDALSYGSPIPLDDLLAADWDKERDFVPFRRDGWTAPTGPPRLLRWNR